MPFKSRYIFDMKNVKAHQEQPQWQEQHSQQKHLSPNGLKHNLDTSHNYTTTGNSNLLQLRKLTSQGNRRAWFMETVRNYCKTTSLHGFNYITRNDISSAERLFWLAIVILSIIISIVLVVVSWFWNRETPTVTVIESSHFSTWNIPFPAITICNFNKLSKSQSANVIKTLRLPPNVTENVVYRLFDATMYFEASIFSTSELETFDKILKINNMTIPILARLLIPDCLNMFARCIWKGMATRCDNLFQRVLTLEGLCCSFNYYGAVTNSFPEKIAYQVPKRPYHVTGCGYPTGLSVLLNPMVYDYYGTFFSSYGFRLLIHDAYNFPDENAETKVVTSNRESFIRITPETTYATNDVRRMDIKLRNCLFGSERRLPTMKRYSFINCMFQCRVQMIYTRCGCIPPYIVNNGSYPKCGILDTNCVTSTKHIFSYALADLNSSLSIVKKTPNFPCNCLPDCQSNHYASEMSVGKLNVNFGLNRRITKTMTNETEYILLHVFFSDLMATRYRMEIFQNWLSTLASFGGLLGLIMGFSIVSAFEFIYFLTFRPMFNFLNQY